MKGVKQRRLFLLQALLQSLLPLLQSLLPLLQSLLPLLLLLLPMLLLLLCHFLQGVPARVARSTRSGQLVRSSAKRRRV